MFLERFAKICFTQIRPFLFFSLLLVPVILVIGYLFFQQLELQDLENHFSSSMFKGKSALAKKQRKEIFLNRYSSADPYFINRQIESLKFLNEEKKELQQLIQHPALANKKIFEERLHFISGEENQLNFDEENIRSSKKIKETDEKQRHIVQMDEKDLEKTLSLIEGVSMGAGTPQLIVRNFQMKKIKTPIQNNEVFEVEMELLKREWLQ